MEKQLSYKQIRCMHLKSVSDLRKMRQFLAAKRVIWWVRLMDGVMKGKNNGIT